MTEEQKEFLWDVKTNNFDAVYFKLFKNPELSACYDECKNTALHWAVKRNNLELVQMLIPKSRILQKNIFDKSPMDYSEDYVAEINYKVNFAGDQAVD